MDNLQISLGVIVTLVIVAFLFDFMNGFHDAANSIATIVSTRVLKPFQALPPSSRRACSSRSRR